MAVYRAQDFVDSLGINVHTIYTDSQYARLRRVTEALDFIKIKHLRQILPSPRNQAYGSYARVAALGYRWTLFVNPHRPLADSLAEVRKLLHEYPDSVAALEGPNEVNNWPVKYADKTGTEAAHAFQGDFYDAVKSDPDLQHLPVYSFTDYPTQVGKSDFANAHPYERWGRPPHISIDNVRERIAAIDPTKPIVITETGMVTNPTVIKKWHGLDAETAGIYNLHIVLYAFSKGIRKTFLYQLLDEFDDPEGKTIQRHFGQFDFSFEPKPAARGLRHLIKILSDKADDAQTFEPAPVTFTMDGLNPEARFFALQKSGGPTYLILWTQESLWDGKTHQQTNIAAQPFVLDLGAADRKVRIFRPLLSEKPVRWIDNQQTVSLNLHRDPVVVEVG